MMKKSFPKQGLPLLALAIALTGCPALDTVSGPGPGPEPTPTPTPTPSATSSPDPDPAFAIKALGPVRMTLESPIDVEHGPTIIRVGRSGSNALWGFGSLGTFGTTALTSGAFDRYTQRPGAENFYVSDYFYGAHYFQEVDSIALVKSGDLTFKFGEATPSAIRDMSSYFELEFPASAQGDLSATPADSSLRFRTGAWTNSESGYAFNPIGTRPLDMLDGTRSATMSVTVSVKELDGAPSKNLAAANFQLSGWGSERITIQATEIAPGRYRLAMGLDNLYSPVRRPQHRTLTVSHTPITHTHTEETN